MSYSRNLHISPSFKHILQRSVLEYLTLSFSDPQRNYFYIQFIQHHLLKKEKQPLALYCCDIFVKNQVARDICGSISELSILSFSQLVCPQANETVLITVAL